MYIVVGVCVYCRKCILFTNDAAVMTKEVETAAQEARRLYEEQNPEAKGMKLTYDPTALPVVKPGQGMAR